jgi:hypothetical protein
MSLVYLTTLPLTPYKPPSNPSTHPTLEHRPITDDLNRRPPTLPFLLGDQPPSLPRRRLQDLSRRHLRFTQLVFDPLGDEVERDHGDTTPFDDGLRIDCESRDLAGGRGGGEVRFESE